MNAVGLLEHVMTTRFFAFGCSFTKYHWPTWADLIGIEYNNAYYNYGQRGAGNMFIFNAVIEANQKHNFTKDDLIIVQWSSLSRNDYYIDNKWITKGGLRQGNYSSDDLNVMVKYFDFRGHLIRDIAFIKSIKLLLDNVGCKYEFLQMVPLFENEINTPEAERLSAESLNDIGELYADVVGKLKPSFFKMLGDRRHNMVYGNTKPNRHPIPSEHLNYCASNLNEYIVSTPVDLTELCAICDKQLFEIRMQKIPKPWRNALEYPWDNQVDQRAFEQMNQNIKRI
jgi:hypothetical protein